MKALRILVVEDEAIVAELLADVLEGMGHDICGIERSEVDAVSAADRCRPDLMIVDAKLSEGSGVSAMEKILHSRFVPHLFVSGDALAVRVLRPDAVIIQKPYFEPELVRGIQNAMDATPAH